MSLAHIDPSLALGFYCDDKNDFEDLIRYTQSIVCVCVCVCVCMCVCVTLNTHRRKQALAACI
jgi:hypothetical protein